MGALEDAGVVLFDPGGLFYLFEPYTWPLMAELERRGIPYVLAWSSSQRQVGGSHRFTGDADVRVYVRVGEQAQAIVPGTRAGSPTSTIRGRGRWPSSRNRSRHDDHSPSTRTLTAERRRRERRSQ